MCKLVHTIVIQTDHKIIHSAIKDEG